MKHKFTFLLSLFISLVFLTGCATVFGGAKNKLVVKEGTPPSADVFLDGQKLGTAPIDEKLSKYLLQEGSIVEIRKEGYKTDTVVIERKVHPWYSLADIVTGVGIGFAVDVATGNIYRPVNNKITYQLEEKK